MKAERIFKKQHEKGEMVFSVSAEKKLFNVNISLDGMIMGTKQEYINENFIIVKLDGKEICESQSIGRLSDIPEKVREKQFFKLCSLGSYGYLNNSFGLSRETYNKIKKLLEECILDVTTSETIEREKLDDELEQKKSLQYEKEAKEYKSLLDSGMCPKCGTWCYGDCEANKN